MNAQPFVQAALAKGEVIGQAMKQIGDYALVRAKAEAEVQYNEAMLAAEEEMRTLAESLKESGRLGDVINEKGTGAWQVQTKDMRERLADGLSSRSMTDQFNARFNQQELTVRFQLRDAIETRIKARAAAAAKARQDALVAQLSDPRTNPDMAAMLLTSQNAELQASVANGIMTPETMAAVNTEMVNKIVGNVTKGYVSADPAKAIALMKALEYQEQVDAGLMTAQKAAELSGLGPDASYTLSVLRMARPDIVIEALGAAVTEANKLDGALDELRTEQTAATNLSNQNLYNSTFGVDPTAPASLDLTQRLQAANPQALALAGISPDQPINGKQYLDAATNALDRQNFMQTEAGESFRLVDDRVASAFNYNRAVAPTDDQAKEAQAAYAFVTAQLTREFNAAREAGNPMTSTQLTTRANELVDERMVSYRATLQLKFRDYLESVMSTNPGANLPNFTPGNELNELDAWYRGLTDPTPTQESVYSALRGQIRNHYSSMGIQ